MSSTPPKAPAPSAVPRRAGNASWRDVEGEMVILDTKGRMLRGLNPTGGVVWTLIDGKRTIDDIALEVARTTDVDISTVRVDMVAFFGELRRLGLVEGI